MNSQPHSTTEVRPDIELARELLKIPSITPRDDGCVQLIADRLSGCQFQSTRYDCHEVSNLWSIRKQSGTTANSAPCIVFAGHVDVVPPGSLDEWQVDPFAAELHGDILYGRGAADMKGAIAAFTVAIENHLINFPDTSLDIGVLLTSDEEGEGVHGTRYVVDQLLANNQKIDYCVLGEPTSEICLGDFIKNGRRGSIIGEIVVTGIVGHTAYPDRVVNPISAMVNAIQGIFDSGLQDNIADYGRNIFQMLSIDAGSTAVNTTPDQCRMTFNIRHTPAMTTVGIQQLLEDVMSQHTDSYSLDFKVLGSPYLSGDGQGVSLVKEVIKKHLDVSSHLSRSGGGSDGRFIAALCPEIIELGLINKTIHKPNECISVTDLHSLACIYEEILNQLHRRTEA